MLTFARRALRISVGLSHVAKAGQIDQLLAIMLLIAIIGMTIDGLIFKRLEHAVRVRWGLA